MTGLLDTGADRTCLSSRSVPRHWKLKESQRPVWGIGGCQNTLETMHPVKWEAEDRQGTVWPLVIPGLSFNIWGRDIMSRLGMRLSNF
uniref:Pro n=1 Tax=Notamacropus eugenii TaxID=9315 RepID=E6Y2W4_NOTEU|nr:Pro [Notamacropus eugenii]